MKYIRTFLILVLCLTALRCDAIMDVLLQCDSKIKFANDSYVKTYKISINGSEKCTLKPREISEYFDVYLLDSINNVVDIDWYCIECPEHESDCSGLITMDKCDKLYKSCR